MRGRSRRLAWVPPFLVGASAAIAAEVAVALLLYSGPGFVRSLTAVLAVAGAAFAGGLWSAPDGGPGTMDALRRRWLLALFAFFAAALFGGAWSMTAVLGGSRWGQAAGLTLLAGLPLFATGGVIGGLVAVAPALPGAGRVGAAAALGAATGAVVTGLLLPRTPLPASVLLSCLVMLSLGGMIFGLISGSALEVAVVAERPSSTGGVRVEDRRRPAAGLAERVLLEGDWVRGRATLGEGAGTVPWDVSVVRSLMPEPDGPWRVLAVGSGASIVARVATEEHAGASVHVLERSPDVLELAREHLRTGLESGRSERMSVAVGNLEDLVKAVRDRYELVLVDASALAPLGGAPGLSREARGRLVQAVAHGGVLAWGPLAPHEGMPELAAGWRRLEFGRDRSGTPPRSPGSDGGDGRAEEVVLLVDADGGPAPSLRVEGFAARNGAGAPTSAEADARPA